MATSADYIRDLGTLGYQFKYNEVTDRVEVNGEPISDVLQAEIRTRMRDMRHKQMNAVEDAYNAHAWANRYHPVRNYFAALTWDGQPHIEKLASYFTDRHDVFPLYLRRWLIGAVAKTYQKTQNFMIVLDGVQGGGKSYFVNWLCPPVLDAYRAEGPVNTDDKDVWLRLAGKWIWEVSEFGNTQRRADREALKDFISRLDVTIRRPYGRYDVIKPALASMIGTINNEGPGFLNDPSGSRRFAVVELTAIDWGYVATDINQLWAEAYTAYQGGERWELTATERARQAAINEEYEQESGLEAMLHKYYVMNPAADVWTPSIDIVLELETYGLEKRQRAALMELATVMKRLGHERKFMQRKWSYKGVIRKAPGVVI